MKDSKKSSERQANIAVGLFIFIICGVPALLGLALLWLLSDARSMGMMGVRSGDHHMAPWDHDGDRCGHHYRKGGSEQVLCHEADHKGGRHCVLYCYLGSLRAHDRPGHSLSLASGDDAPEQSRI